MEQLTHKFVLLNFDSKIAKVSLGNFGKKQAFTFLSVLTHFFLGTDCFFLGAFDITTLRHAFIAFNSDLFGFHRTVWYR